jgi:streptogramin lyase
MDRRNERLALSLTLSLLCACSSGTANLAPHASATATPAPSRTASPNPVPTQTPTAVPTASAAPTATPAGANVAFTIAVPPASAASSARAHRLDVSASAQSVTVAIGSTVLATGNVAAGSPACTSGPSTRTCTIAVVAPPGSDTFVITAYDAPNGTGNVLASGSVTLIAPPPGSAPATAAVTLNGTIARIALTIANPYPPVGTATTSPVVVTAYDADGNTVIGAYDAPVALTDADTSGATTLSPQSLGSSSSVATLGYSGAVPFISTTLTATLAGLPAVSQTFAPTPQFLRTWPIPVPPGPFRFAIAVSDMVLGPDGNLWSTANSGSEIEKLTPQGAITDYPLPTGGSNPERIAVGADGNLWFAENGNNAIGKIAPAGGTITEYAVPLGAAGQSEPNCVVLGSDNRIWFWDESNDVLGAITSAGVVSEYPGSIPATAAVEGITSGPDGNIWVADQTANAIDKVSTAGALLASYPIPTAGSNVYYLAPGPDGNVWFTEFQTGKIGRVTPSGTMTEWSTPTGASGPFVIVPGPDGRMWFGEMGAEVGLGKIGYITTDGKQSRDFLGDGLHVRALAFDRAKLLYYVGGWSFEPQEFGKFGY